jgi:hypothetical protein
MGMQKLLQAEVCMHLTLRVDTVAGMDDERSEVLSGFSVIHHPMDI